MHFLLKSIFRMKNVALIMIVQLAVSLCLVNIVTELKDYSQNKSEKLGELFNIDNTYLISIRNDNNFNDKLPCEEYKLYDEIGEDLLGLKGTKGFVDIYSYLPLYAAPESFFKLSDNDNSNGRAVYDFLVDENFVKRYPLKVTKGRTFNEKDFNINPNTDNIPVLLGAEYNGKAQVGDVITGELVKEFFSPFSDKPWIYENFNFEVIGLLEPNELIWFDVFPNISYKSSFQNSTVVFPTVSNIHSLSYENTLGSWGMFFEISNETDISNVHEIILETLKPYEEKYGYKFTIYESIDLKGEFSSLAVSLDRDSSVTKLLAAALTILAFLGITSTMLGEVNRRKKEFGVRLSQGATINKLCLEIFLEIYLISLISSVISFLIVWYINKAITLTISILITNLLFITFLTCLISLIPLIRLRSMEVIELIRGR